MTKIIPKSHWYVVFQYTLPDGAVYTSSRMVSVDHEEIPIGAVAKNLKSSVGAKMMVILD